jgi:hypothetical protein
MSKRPLINDSKRVLADRGHDLYQTPPEAVRALLRVEFCWDRNYRGPTVIKRITWKPEQICAGCGEWFDSSRAHAVTCSPRCRQRLHRSRKPSHFAARRRASVTRERLL